MGPDRDGGKVTEGVSMGVDRHRRNGAPREVGRVKEVGRRERRVFRKDAEKVRMLQWGKVGLTKRENQGFAGRVREERTP